MKFQNVLLSILVLILPVALLAACASSEPAQTVSEEGGEPAQVVGDAGSAPHTGEALDTSYEDALSVSDQLMLGTLLLEETEHAVTPEQATALLPMWQVLQAGGVTAEAEVNAVLKQIEREMTQEQLQAIAAMQLTQEDLQAWMEEQGIGAGAPGADGDMTGEEREAARATAQAGGMPEGGEMPPEMAARRAEMENMTDEEREAARATMQASGGEPDGRGGPGGGQANALLRPLINLLEERAG